MKKNRSFSIDFFKNLFSIHIFWSFDSVIGHRRAFDGFLSGIFFCKDCDPTVAAMPKKIDGFRRTPAPRCLAKNELGIIMQGPWDARTSALNARLVRKYFPHNPFVVSSWKKNEVSLRELQDDLSVIWSEDCGEPGIGNVNLQTYSTTVGIRWLENLGVKRVLKMRTDTLLASIWALNFLDNILSQFSVETSTRIVGIEANRYIPYKFDDRLVFGDLEVIKDYFRPTRDCTYTQNLSSQAIIKGVPVCPETVLFSRFVEGNGHKANWTMLSWLECLQRYTVITDSSALGFRWSKSPPWTQASTDLILSDKYSRNVSFAEWLALFNSSESQLLEQASYGSQEYYETISPLGVRKCRIKT